MDEAFERFARRVCEFCMERFVVPYLRERGYVMSYRAQVVRAGSSAGTLVVQRPFDAEVTLPCTTAAAELTAGAQCLVLAFGDSSNAIVASDGSFDLGGGLPPARGEAF